MEKKLFKLDFFFPQKPNRILACINNHAGEQIVRQVSSREICWAISWQKALNQQPILKGLPEQHAANTLPRQTAPENCVTNSKGPVPQMQVKKAELSRNTPPLLQLFNTNSKATHSCIVLQVSNVCLLQKSCSKITISARQKQQLWSYGILLLKDSN